MVIQGFLDEIADMGLGAEPGALQLETVARLMVGLAGDVRWRERYRAAVGVEELLYVLHEEAGGPSLYLVSDGASVRSAPHRHGTWAVIAGIAGNEMNVLYERVEVETERLQMQAAQAAGRVREVSRVGVKAGDAIWLGTDAGHATEALDGVATFHLHLHGRPLRELAPYPSRCYIHEADEADKAD